MKRVVVPALVASLLLVLGAIAVWIVAARVVGATIAAQGRLAGELLDARVPVSEVLARTLVRPGLHVVIEDPETGTLIDADDSVVRTLPLPPGGLQGLPGFAPSGRPPVGGPQLGAPPPGGLPPGGPLLGGAPAPGTPGSLGLPSGPMERFTLWAAGTPPPARVLRGDRTIVIGPNIRELATWLFIDALAIFVGTSCIALVATRRAVSLQQAERRALEAHASERRDAADRYQRFLAETGHELRTPLTVLAGYVDILRRNGAERPLDARVVDGMYAETSRMRVLVEKMLILARLEAETSVPRLLDVATAATEAAQLIQRRYPERNVTMKPESSASIVIDADDFAAALGNILENAIKFAPDSPIVVETNVRDGNAITSVEDRGPGVPPMERHAIFERYYRGRGRDVGEGVGLGLAIVKRIAERWNGTALCESGAGRTVIHLAFPVADEEMHGVAR
jgi:signal transduction histidine kinase